MSNGPKSGSTPNNEPRGLVVRFLDAIEWAGNKLPDPAVLFLIGIISVWVLSAWLSTFSFAETLPGKTDPVKVTNMLQPDQLAKFLANCRRLKRKLKGIV